MRDRHQGSDPQFRQRENGHSKHGTTIVYEVEKSDSVRVELVETTFEVHQGHRGHVNRV